MGRKRTHDKPSLCATCREKPALVDGRGKQRSLFCESCDAKFYAKFNAPLDESVEETEAKMAEFEAQLRANDVGLRWRGD